MTCPARPPTGIPEPTKRNMALTNVVPLNSDKLDNKAVDQERERRADSAVQNLMALLAEDLAKVNHVILDRMGSKVPLIPELAGHLISSGGKRLRPMLSLAATRMCGYTGQRHIPLAAAVEFIHTATLLHDDVVDESNLRRGQQTANNIWGDEASVLVGDFLFSRSFQLMVEDGSVTVLGILANASAVISEGEVMQLMSANDIETTEDTYLQIIIGKTATLFAAACEIGAVIAGRPKVEQEALESYGRNLGIAFQLIDDVLDYSASQETLGKTVGDDFREGKLTLPVILAHNRGTESDRQFWRRTIAEGDQHDGDLTRAIDLMGQYDALADTVERARHYGAIARDALGIFPDVEEKKALSDIVDFCIDRAH